MSSFSFLKDIPVDYIKIDGRFIQNIDKNSIDYSIVEAIQHVAGNAQIQTIAETVEERAVTESLKEIGVDFIQGYSVEMPRPVEQEFVSVYSA